MTGSGGWRSLLEILDAARSEAGQPHPEDDECPYCGTDYKTGGAENIRYCPFDGYRPGGQAP
jgi:hypothetical protein